MQSFLEKLLDLRTLTPGQEGVQIGFWLTFRPYEWAIVCILCAAAAWWSYRKIEGPLWARAGLGTTRGLLLLLLALLLSGPKLVRPNESVEKDWVLMLVDRSSSLRIEDAPSSLNAQRASREDQLNSALSRGWGAISSAAKDRVMVWLGFDTGAYDLKPNPAFDAAPTPTLDERPVFPFLLDSPAGSRTDVGVAIDQALARSAARPLSGVVIFSDGRSVSKASRAAIKKLQAERVPVITVPLGSEAPMMDIGIRAAQGPGVAFVMDVVPIEVTLERTGSDRSIGATRVQLLDATGRVLDEQPVIFESTSTPTAPLDPTNPQPRTTTEWPAKRITLTSTPETPGTSTWTVRVIPDGQDLLPGNNELAVGVETVDRPLRVLYLDGYPRWEYRFLQAILTREKSVASTATLLSAGRRYLQEGNTPMPAIPTSPQEWATIDTIVIGDLNPDVLSTEQLRQIRDRVSIGGAGLLWIAGQGALPGAWRNTPLADLLPMSVSGSEKQRDWAVDVTMRPTPLADRLGVLRLLRTPAEGSWWPETVSDPESGWSRLKWAQRIDPASLKPAAETLALAVPLSSDDGEGPDAPGVLIATMRFGAGRTVYVATDEIWRWRYGRGEDLPERFWLQLIRLLGRDSVARSGQRAVLSTSPIKGEVTQPVRINLELIDQSLADAAPASVNVRVVRTGEIGTTAPANAPGLGEPVSVVLRSGGEPRRPSTESRPTFAGTFIGQERGTYRVTIDDPLLRDLDAVRADFELWLGDDELRRPETDHALLAQLAAETGGAVLAPSDLSRLADLLPRREVHIALAPDEESLWDKPIAFALLLLLLTIEWTGRRLIRLA